MSRYKFAPYTGTKSKGTCPNCGEPNVFRYYVDTETGEYLPEYYGICDRELHCAYHYSPYENPPEETTGKKVDLKLLEEPAEYNTIPESIFNKSFDNQFKDNLSTYLIRKFGKEAIKTLEKYKVGYSTKFNGHSTVFWQIDNENKVRSGKIMKYTLKGKRDKKDFPKIDWVHSSFKGNYLLQQCFFGLHLLNDSKGKIIISEGEKTSIILDIVKKGNLYLSSSQLHGLSEHKFIPLKGREIILLPDKGFYNTWNEKAKELSSLGYNVICSDTVEKDRQLEEGNDIADKILKNI